MTVKELTLDIAPCRILFTLTAKQYKKTLRKEFNIKEDLNVQGRLLILTKKTNLSLVIGIKIEDIHNIIECKGILVHELSHTVTEIMNFYGFECDEFRSYTLQKLYLDTVTLIDDYYMENNNEND